MPTSEYIVDINTSVDCQTRNLIYMLGCKKCPTQYIGETNRTLQDRFSEHLGHVKNKHLNKLTGEHFNSKGHKQSDMTITVIEKQHNTSNQFRKQREMMYISKFNTKYKGMNQKTWANCNLFFLKHLILVQKKQHLVIVLIVLSQSDVYIVKISKYITDEL